MIKLHRAARARSTTAGQSAPQAKSSACAFPLFHLRAAEAAALSQGTVLPSLRLNKLVCRDRRKNEKAQAARAKQEEEEARAASEAAEKAAAEASAAGVAAVAKKEREREKKAMQQQRKRIRTACAPLGELFSSVGWGSARRGAGWVWGTFLGVRQLLAGCAGGWGLKAGFLACWASRACSWHLLGSSLPGQSGPSPQPSCMWSTLTATR